MAGRPCRGARVSCHVACSRGPGGCGGADGIAGRLMSGRERGVAATARQVSWARARAAGAHAPSATMEMTRPATAKASEAISVVWPQPVMRRNRWTTPRPGIVPAGRQLPGGGSGRRLRSELRRGSLCLAAPPQQDSTPTGSAPRPRHPVGSSVSRTPAGAASGVARRHAARLPVHRLPARDQPSTGLRRRLRTAGSQADGGRPRAAATRW